MVPCYSRYPAGAVIKRRCERCGFVAPWRETFFATGATFTQWAPLLSGQMPAKPAPNCSSITGITKVPVLNSRVNRC
jgi:hypothetical protein